MQNKEMSGSNPENRSPIKKQHAFPAKLLQSRQAEQSGKLREENTLERFEDLKPYAALNLVEMTNRTTFLFAMA